MKELSLNNCRLDKRYDIRDTLGRGSYAEIFLARDIAASPESPHSEVVIKALNVFLQDDVDVDLERTLVENFQNEAVALDRVRHPNIISRLGHGTSRDLRGTIFHYLILEYLSGGNLQRLVRQSPLDLLTALGYIEQVCAGLSHAHSRGVIHRDIKPQNLLLTADKKTVKIADFGVARMTVSESPITRVGTNIYAPPEHSPLSAGRTGELGHGSLTPAADVYSLAKTVYTIISGEAPRAFVNEMITSLPKTLSESPAADMLLRVLSKATEADPGRRHASIREFWGDLSEVRQQDAQGVYADPPSREIPRPHVSAGYTAAVPAAPDFDPVSQRLPRLAPGLGAVPAMHLPRNPGTPRPIAPTDTQAMMGEGDVVAVKRRGKTYSLITFLVVIGLFTGLLYGTATYMRGKGVLPGFADLFRSRTAVANTDIYLRPTPNTDSEPIGLVTKNSKVRIVNSQNNWYQVDVVEQGRTRSSQPGASRGWLNGKYLEIDGN